MQKKSAAKIGRVFPRTVTHVFRFAFFRFASPQRGGERRPGESGCRPPSTCCCRRWVSVLRCLIADIRSWPSFRANTHHPSNRLGVNGFVHGSNTEGSNSYLLQQPITAEGSDNFVALEDIALISASSASSADLMSPAGLPRRSRRRRTNAYGRWCR